MRKFLIGILIATSVTAFAQTSTNDIRLFGGQRVKNSDINWAAGERPQIVEEPTICTMDRGKLGMVNVRLEPGDRVLGYFKKSDAQFDYYELSRFGDCGNRTIGEVRIKRKAGMTTVVKPEAKRAMLPPPPAPGDVNVYTSLNLDIPINVTTNNYAPQGDRPQRPLPGATMIAGVRSESGLSALSYGAGSRTTVTQIGGGATATGGNATATGGQGGQGGQGGNASASSSSSSTSTSTAAASAKSKGK